MRPRLARALVGVALAAACTPRAASEQRAAPSADPATGASAVVAPSASDSAAATSAAAKPDASSTGDVAEISKLVVEPDGHMVAELRRTPPARAWVTLSTREAPLLPRAQAAHARIAELVAPGLVAPTWFRRATAKELARAADGPTQARLAKRARVLSDGNVELSLSLAPAAHLQRVDLVALSPDGRASSWETALSGREAIPEALGTTLGLYQSLLAVDYIAGNLTRRSVHFHEKSGRITAAEDNEAFSAKPEEGALKEGLARLTRHMTYSKGLYQRLGELERDGLEKALVWGKPPTLLVTPKQLDEALDHARAVRRVIEMRIKQRGKERALELP